jgi:hypothetical protein
MTSMVNGKGAFFPRGDGAKAAFFPREQEFFPHPEDVFLAGVGRRADTRRSALSDLKDVTPDAEGDPGSIS